ncbi:jerky protein homolog-like [Harmonia axyridis]|uniref:jerky protein homolog-like n=1 Tax=Harmonia axyridis TaxID=115357 RepID=UPI001E275B5F|nr:jerky protein homolog-like [Harmonia axyridis]
MPPKCLTLFEKANILDEHKKGLSVTALSVKYGVAKSTICSIKKKAEKIKDSVNKTLKPSKKRTLRRPENPKMERKLYKWFLNQRKHNVPVTGDMIKHMASKLHEEFKETNNFNASDGWLQRFKIRHGVRFLKITGEKLSSQPELVDPFKQKLKNLIQEHHLSNHQIYNADETGLFWKLLPDKTFVALSEKAAPGLKMAKQRITLLGCVNANGSHKLTPLLIGKAAKPRCFKNFKNPFIYKHSKNAWMTIDILKTWFFHHFIPEVRSFLRGQKLPQKAILILDNAPCHPPAEELRSSDGIIFTVYMPPNVTPLIQPMDQNILRLTKLHYRRSLLSQIVSQKENITDALKRLTLKDCVAHLQVAWIKLDAEMISKCWKNLFDRTEDFTDEDNIPLSMLQEMLNREKVVVKDTISLLMELQPVSKISIHFHFLQIFYILA